MRPEDKLIFSAAAVELRSWILVRETKASSTEHIGKPGFTPKPMSCKAKTADNNVGKYKVAGLVVNPHLLSSAFSGSKIVTAIDAWTDTNRLVGKGPEAKKHGFYVIDDVASPYYGCLTIDGKLVHGDYDLYDVVNVKYKRSNLALVERVEVAPGVDMEHRKGYLIDKVADYVNSRIGVPMVQHGGEAQFAPRITDQKLEGFAPDGTTFHLDNREQIRKLYATTFEGRRVIGQKH